MTIGICRSLSNRNVSFLLQSASNQSVISDAEWVVNGISLMIFLLALLGNTAALLVMFASRGPIRLTNNKYLANLACADLLRACFIPFTVIARMKRNFIFGRLICKILPVVQGLFHLLSWIIIYLVISSIRDRLSLSSIYDLFLFPR